MLSLPLVLNVAAYLTSTRPSSPFRSGGAMSRRLPRLATPHAMRHGSALVPS